MRPRRLLFLGIFIAFVANGAVGAADPATAADEALLKEAGVATDGPGLLAFFRKRTLTDADRKRLELLVRQLGSTSYKQRQEAQAELVALGAPSLPFLKAAEKDPNVEVRKRALKCSVQIENGPASALPAAAARLLAVRRPAGAVAALLAYIPYVDDEWLEEEVLIHLGSLAVVQGKVDPLLAAAVQDKLPARRAAAAYVLGRMGGPEQRTLVRRMLADPEAVVRRHAAEGLAGKEITRAADDGATADETLFKEMKLATDAAALTDFFRKRSLNDEDRQHLKALVRQLGDPVFKKRQQATAELIQMGTAALAFVRPAVHDDDLEVIRRAEKIIETIERGPGPALPGAATRLLVKRAPADAVATLLKYVPSADDDTVEEAVLAALCALSIREVKVDPALPAALRDAVPARRAAAAFVLGRIGSREQCEAARKLLADGDARVRLRAAQGMIFAKDKSAVGVLLEIVRQEENPAVAGQAEEVLRQLAGDMAPPESVALGKAEERQKARAAWQTWWQEQSGKVDLARLIQKPAELGLTVICEFDSTRSGGGHAWEFGRDFKPRWMLQNLQGPMDVHVLGEDRLLVAEYYGQRVTERSKKGEIKWEHHVSGNPVACGRLSNGNTFIATYTNLIEVTPQKKVVYDYNRGADGQIWSAQKVRNGNIVYMTSMGWVVTLNARGQVLHRFNVGNPGNWCGVEWLPNGRLLVTQMVSGKIMEVDAATGQKVFWQTTVTGAHQTLRLSNGHTLVVCMNNKRLVEVNRAGKTVWEKPMEGRPWRVHRR
jgi:HEAT repeat protein